MINEIIKLQTLEKKCIDIEKQISSSVDKKDAQQAVNSYKMAQVKTVSLDEEAKKLVEELTKLQGVQEKGVSLVDKYATQTLDGLTEQEISEMKSKVDKTIFSLNELEKRLYAFNERVKKTLVASDETRKQAIAAKKTHQQAKENFTKSIDEVSAELAENKEKITELMAKIDEKWLKKYNSLRAEGVFPVVVPFINNRCGGCRMELPALAVEKLKKDKYLDCPSCHRIIFIKNEK